MDQRTDFSEVAPATAPEPGLGRKPLWRRVLKWALIVLVLLIALLLFGLFVLPKTDTGRGIVDGIARPIVEDVVRQQLGSEVEFAPLGGALPGELIIDDLSLSEGGEVWFSADRVRLDWSPLALIRREVVVGEFALRGAELHRQPPAFPEQPPKPEEEPRPLDLPSITVDRLVVDPFTLDERVLGTEYVITALASAQAAGQDVTAEAEVETRSGSDRIVLAVDYDPETLGAEVSVTGRSDGLISTLSGADGPVTVSLDGEGALADWRGALEGEVGTYGGVTATLGGDLVGLRDASFQGTVRTGPGLPEVAGQLVGDALEVDLSTTGEGEAMILAIDRLAGRFGDLRGTVRLSSLAAEEVAVDIDGALSRAVATEFGAEQLAGRLSLDAQASQLEPGWGFSGTLATPSLTARVEDGRSTPDALFAGDVTARSPGLTLGNERLDPLLEGGLQLRASVDYAAEGVARIADIDARVGAGETAVTVTGDATYEAEGQAFGATLSLAAARQALATLLGTGEYAGPLTADVTASGTPQDARLALTADIPAGEIDGQGFGAGRLTADLSGLPGAPAGTARLVSADGAYAGELVAASRGEVVQVDTLRFEGGQLSLSAGGQVNPTALSADVEFRVDAGEGTTLITGQTVRGTANGRVAIAPDQGPVDVAIDARGLAFDAIEVGSAQVTAQGPLSAIEYGVSVDDAALPGDVFLSLLNTSGTADVASPQRRIVVRELRAALDEDVQANRIELMAPTTVEFGEVVSLSETRIDWLGDGFITAEGRYAPDLWVARANATGIEVPGLPASAELTLDVDTRNEVPATFAATATSEPDEDGDAPVYTLQAEGRWTGQEVSLDAFLGRPGAERVMTAAVSLPVILTRTDALGVEVPEDGQLDGTVRYDDDLSPLYAFLPTQERYLTGDLNADVALSGALSAPEVRGTVRLADGRVEEDTYGFELRDLQAAAEFDYAGDATNAVLTLTAADANGDEGAVSLRGDVSFGAEASSVDVALTLDEARLADSAALELETDAAITLRGPVDGLRLEGEVDIGSLDAQIPTIEGGDDAPDYVPVNVVRTDGPPASEPDEAAEETGPVVPFEVALDLTIVANNEVFVRGRGLDSEWEIDMRVGGTTLAPDITGGIGILDGTFDFAGREFDLTRGRVDFQGGAEIDPRLDVLASLEVDETTAQIGVRGPASDPEIVLSSTPPLPDEDVMALILFGKPPTDLTAIEALQMANAVAKLTGTSPLGGGGPGVTDKLRSGLGLDALSLGVGDDGAAAVGIGKYITDDFYVSARQSAGDAGTEIIMTYEVTDDIVVESTLKPNGAQGVSANYKKDY